MRVVLFLTAIVSSLAVAQAVPTIGAAGSGDGSKAAYRGTSVSYGATTSVYNYSPEVIAITHRLGIMPEWHFGDHFGVRGRLYLSQELTNSDTTYNHEVDLSDLWVDGVWGGWKEANTGIRLAADLRVTLPTSKFSQAMTRVMTVGPGANVSKSFKVLAGLTFIYSARFTYRFNRFTTRQNAGGQIEDHGSCPTGLVAGASLIDTDACHNTNTGSSSVVFDVIHGPTVSFSPHERLNISASLFMQRGWVPALAANAFVAAVPMQSRDFIGFSLGVTYQPWDVVGFTLGAFTFANQLTTEGKTIFPLFNRNTVASLDATFDLEAIVSSITKEKK